MKMAAKGSIDMAEIDFKRSAELLHIVEKCAAHGPKLSAISNAAMAELNALNNKLREGVAKEAKLQAAVEAKAVVQAQPPEMDEEPDVEPSVYPGDSETATIADRRL